MPIEPFDFTYTLTSQSEENEVLNTLGKGRIKEFEPKSYFFTESTIAAQSSAEGAYGPDFVETNTKFNITTQFELANKKAYAVTSGQILIFPQSGTGNESKVNVFIKPLKHVDVGVPIKYYVYRGLKKELFINSSNNILPKDSTNTPFITKMWTDLVNFNELKEPLPEIPASLFGFSTTETNTNSLDAKFFNTYTVTSTDENKVYNLPIIEAGQYFGEFQDNKGGFEIVLNDGFYYQEKSDTGFQFDLNFAKVEKAVLDVANIANNPNISEKIYRENVQKFLDPAAFYGAHITEKQKGEIKVVDNNTKYNTKADIYNNIISKFFNKHKCYLYIQCNRGRSFNFDETLTAPLKIGVAGAVSPSEYKTDSWPIIVSEFEQIHSNGETDVKKTINNLSFELKFKTINKKASLYNIYGNCVNENIEGNFLNSNTLVNEANITTQDYTNTINYKLINNYNLPNTSLTTKCIAGLIYITHEEKEVEYFNDFFGPINIKPIIKLSHDVSGTLAKVVNYNSKLKFSGDLPSVYKQELIVNGKITVPTESSPGEHEDNRTRLYVLKRFDSTNTENKDFAQYTSDSGYSFASSKEEYSTYIYGDQNYSVWKSSIVDGTETIDTVQLADFGKDNNLINFVQLGLTEIDFNKLIYNSTEIIENSTHIPANATSLFFHLDDYGIIQNSNYKKYKLGVKHQSYNLSVYTEAITYPTDDIYIYTIDGCYFFSKDYSNKFKFENSIENHLDNFMKILDPQSSGDLNYFENLKYTQEEFNNLSNSKIPNSGYWRNYPNGNSNKSLFELDSLMKNKIIEFKEAIDNVAIDKTAIENLLGQKGQELLNYAKQAIKSSLPCRNKDGILYLTRLIMQVILKNHPKILLNFYNHIESLSDTFEKYSRGLKGTEKPDFSSYSNYKILISGYDPFGSAFPGAYFDWQGHQSNPSGNLALALDGVELTSSNGKKAMIKSAIFPVRFREFDKGWIEDFFTPYVNDDVKMIITFSYGGAEYFNIDRFSSRYRDPSNKDNSRKPGGNSNYLLNSNKDDYEFIETTLPKNDFIQNSSAKIVLHQKARFEYYNNDKKVHSDHFENFALSPLVPFPNITNYPTPNGIMANKIKAVEGSGGDYLSNEIFYRVSYLRKTLKPNKLTGHIHVGFLKGDPSTDRDLMLSTIKNAIKEAINNF